MSASSNRFDPCTLRFYPPKSSQAEDEITIKETKKTINKRSEEKNITIPVYVSISHTLNGIRCIRAARDIKKDELIESSPIILIPKNEQDTMDDAALGSYTYDWNSTHGAFILGYCLLTNHSFTPNIVYKRDFEMLQMNYYALRNIKKGEELFINYNGRPHDTSPLERHYTDYKY